MLRGAMDAAIGQQRCELAGVRVIESDAQWAPLSRPSSELLVRPCGSKTISNFSGLQLLPQRRPAPWVCQPTLLDLDHSIDIWMIFKQLGGGSRRARSNGNRAKAL